MLQKDEVIAALDANGEADEKGQGGRGWGDGTGTDVDYILNLIE